MNKYETIFIINNDISEEEKRNTIGKIEQFIIDNGKITNAESLGKKKLAYKIKGHSEGYYYLIEFESKTELIPELERIYRITDEIIKFITVRKED